MTEKDIVEKESAQKAEKKQRSFLTKIVVIFSVVVFSYIGFKYWQAKSAKEQARSELAKFNNIDSDIFDLSDDAKDQPNPEDISEMTINEMRERGAEFIYQILLKNQVQIDSLKSDVALLKGEIMKYKNQEKIAKMILIYVDLRSKIFAGEKFDNELKNFDILSGNNPDLQKKVEVLKDLLPKHIGAKQLAAEFKQLIPDLIVTKKYGEENGIMAKVRRNLSKLVVVRRIDEKGNADLDNAIAKIEKALQQQNCEEALHVANSLDEKYKKILSKFLADLTTSAEVQKIDQEILNFLKSLT